MATHASAEPRVVRSRLPHLAALPAPTEAADGSRILGTSAYARDQRKLARFVVRYRANMLVEGETGSGKDVFLDEMERLAGDRPVIRLPAGNVPGGLFSAEMFGHDKGAFTDAVRSTVGFAARAHRGWLVFNDADAGGYSDKDQRDLLAIAEGRQFWIIGKSERPVRSDVRLIMVIHQQVVELIGNGLRADLAYRLQRGHHVRLLPLGEHLEDVQSLAKALLDRICSEWEVPVPVLGQDAVSWLERQAYPGNIRELEVRLYEAVRRMLWAEESGALTARYFGDEAPIVAVTRPRRRRRAEVSAEEIARARAEHRRMAEVAEAVGLSVRSLERRLKELQPTCHGGL